MAPRTAGMGDGNNESDLPRRPQQSSQSDTTMTEEKAVVTTANSHEAHTPSTLGYALDEPGEEKPRNSLGQPISTSNEWKQTSSDDGRVVDVERDASATDVEIDGAGEEPEDPNIVWWDGPDDPENPYNWPTWRKMVVCALVSGMTFITPLGSSIFAPGVPSLMKEFHSDNSLLSSFVVSVYVLGFAAGPLLCAPLSEVYGRTIVYHVCNFCFVCFIIGCAAAPDLNSLIVFRFFAGAFGACPITNGGGTIADTVPQEQRGIAMSLFSLGPLLGPVVGPIAGGFMAETIGWRWSFWVLAIVGGVLGGLMLICLRETYAPVILERKAQRLREQTGNPLLRSKLSSGLSPADHFKRGIIRPMKMLARSPIITALSLYLAVVYGYLYLMFTSITIVFMEYYHFNTGTAGLAYMGIGIGSLLGMTYFSLTSDKYIQKKAAEADAVARETGEPAEGMKPEYRMFPLPVGAICLPIGLFVYGWTAEKHVQWMAPIIGMGIVGFGNLIIFMVVQLYLVDAFTIYAASALAANAVVRSIFGALLPLAGLKMFSALGVGWGNSVLGFIALALLPVPLVIMRNGESLRKRFELKKI